MKDFTIAALLGGPEMIIPGVAILLFVGKKIPELMKGLGKGIKEFKQGQQDEPIPAPVNEKAK